jgi:hypothetical protein
MRSQSLLRVLLGTSLLTPAISAHAQFDFNQFQNTDPLNIVHDAVVQGGVLRLTPAAYHLEGAAWHQVKQPVAEGFTTTFSFRMLEVGGLPEFTSSVEAGADGFAFVIQNTSPTALGATGEGIGYKNLKNSVAIEFDTFDNGPIRWEGNGDPNNNHISVNTQGTGSNNSFHYASLGATTDIPILSDGAIHNVMIDYTPGTLSVFIDDMSAPALSVSIDLSTKLSLDNGKAWVGFVSSTGAVWETHDILNWTFMENADYFVDPVAGSDLNDGTTRHSAFRSITKAVSEVPAESVIRLLPGICSSQTGESFPILIHKPLSIIGQDRDKCIIHHETTENIRTLIVKHTPGNCTLSNFTIVGGFTGLTHDPFPYHGSTLLAKNLLIMMTREHAILVNRDGARIEDCIALQNPSSGILYLAFEEGSCTIDRCISAGNRIHGFDHFNPSDLLLRNSLAVGNLQHGVFITDSGRAVLTNLTASRNTLNGIEANSPFVSRVANCVLHQNKSGLREAHASADPEAVNNLFFGNVQQYIDDQSVTRNSQSAINDLVDNGTHAVENNLLADPLFIETSLEFITGGSMTSVHYDSTTFTSTVGDASVSWVPNEWKNSFLLVGSAIRPKIGYLISGNTANTLTVYADITDPLYGKAEVGHPYQIISYDPVADSPLVDAGDDELDELGAFDSSGRNRIAGLGIDIGALEFGSTYPEPTPTVQPTNTSVPGPTGTPTASATPTPFPTPTRTVNQPPSMPAVRISPENPTTQDDLFALATGSIDPEGQPLFYLYEWYRNDSLVSNETDFLSHTSTAKGDEITCLVRSSDGHRQSAPGEDTVIILNSPPSAPVVRILPPNPSPRSGLAVRIETESVDPDGDTVLYLIEWFESDDGVNWTRRPELSGNLKPFVAGEPEISSLYTQVAEFWRVQVTPVEAHTVSKKGETSKGEGEPIVGQAGTDTVLILPDVAASLSGGQEGMIDSDDLLVLLGIWGVQKSDAPADLLEQFFDASDLPEDRIGLRHLLILARYGWHRTAQSDQEGS